MRDILLEDTAGKVANIYEIKEIYSSYLKRTPLNCSCGDVDQIDDVDINDITEEQYKQR